MGIIVGWYQSNPTNSEIRQFSQVLLACLSFNKMLRYGYPSYVKSGASCLSEASMRTAQSSTYRYTDP